MPPTNRRDTSNKMSFKSCLLISNENTLNTSAISIMIRLLHWHREESAKSPFCFSSQILMRIVLCTSHIFCIDLETFKMIFLISNSPIILTKPCLTLPSQFVFIKDVYIEAAVNRAYFDRSDRLTGKWQYFHVGHFCNASVTSVCWWCGYNSWNIQRNELFDSRNICQIQLKC